MNRRAAGLFLLLLNVAVIFLFTIIILMVTSKGIPTDNAFRIGEKQEGIIQAHQRAQGVRFYAERVAIDAAANAEQQPDLTMSIESQALQEFERYLRKHPIEQLSTTLTATLFGNDIIFRGDLTIPVDLVYDDPARAMITLQRTTAFRMAGDKHLAVWPVEGDTVLTSLFGKRNLASSPHTAGIDIRARDGVGMPVRAGGGGRAVAAVQDVPGDRDVPQVHLYMDSGMVCEYLHVTPGFTGERRVRAGEQIGRVAAWYLGPHVDIRCYDPKTLSVTQAKTAFPNNWGTSGKISPVVPADTTLVIIQESLNKAYIDPFCVLSPELQEHAIAWLEANPTHVQTRLRYELDQRDGATLREELFDTCTYYGEVFGENDAPILTGAESAVLIKTLEGIASQRSADGAPLTRVIEEVAAQVQIDPNLIVAMIAAESRGIIDATSPSGVRGLMQVTCDTAMDSVPEYVRTRADCDKLYDARLSILAGARHMKMLMDRTWAPGGNLAFTHAIGFMAAEYNGGAPVRIAVARMTPQNPDPPYDDAMRSMTTADLLPYAPYNQWTEEQRQNKVREITNHGRKVSTFYSQLGGAVAPLETSTTRQGTYQFPFETRVSVSAASIRLRQLAQALRECHNDACIQNVLLSQGATSTNLAACGSYPEETSRSVQLCAPRMVHDACSCRITAPPGTVTGAVFRQDELFIGTATGPVRRDLDWLGQIEEEIDSLTYRGVNESGDWKIAPDLIWNGTAWRIDGNTISNEPVLWVEYALTPDGPALIITEDARSALCAPSHTAQYCADTVTFWVEHTFTTSSVAP